MCSDNFYEEWQFENFDPPLPSRIGFDKFFWCFLCFSVVVHVEACYCFASIEMMFVHKGVLHLVSSFIMVLLW